MLQEQGCWYGCSNVAKLDIEKSIQLVFSENAYASTSEWIKFNFSKTFNLQKTFKLFLTAIWLSHDQF